MEEPMNRYRYFKCYHNDTCFGRFRGRKPKQAACKAFTKLIKLFRGQNLEQDDQEFIFSIKEITRNSKKKSYTYTGSRIQFDRPCKVQIMSPNGERKDVIFRYKNCIKRNYDYDQFLL